MRTVNPTKSRMLPWIATLGWVVVASAWFASMLLERTRPWEGIPQQLFMLGAAALLGTGVVVFLIVLEARHEAGRPVLAKVGMVLLALGVAASFIAWAVPFWAAVYGVGMTVLAVAGLLRRTTGLLAASFLGSVVAHVVMTALKVGTPDAYGDYGVAGAAAVLLATIGPALALGQLARETSEPGEPAMAAAH